MYYVFVIVYIYLHKRNIARRQILNTNYFYTHFTLQQIKFITDDHSRCGDGIKNMDHPPCSPRAS